MVALSIIRKGKLQHLHSIKNSYEDGEIDSRFCDLERKSAFLAIRW